MASRRGAWGGRARPLRAIALLVALALTGGFVAACDSDAGSIPTQEAVETDAWTPDTPEPSLEPEPTAMAVELADALEAGFVDLSAQGRNLQQLDIELESKVEFSIEVEIRAGTRFSTSSSGVQPMIVITDTYLEIEPKAKVEWSLDVACGAMNKDEPTAKNGFRLASKPAPADVRRLVAVDAFHDATFRVQQFAIWTITDNPSRSGYVGLGIGGVGSGPTKAELREIRALFKAAGIDVANYRALS